MVTENGSRTEQDAATTRLLATLSDELAGAVETVAVGVVTVNARRRLPSTGIVWTGNGLVVTANHTVERDEEITLGLPDGRTAEATLVGRDPGTDIALLRTTVGDVTVAPRSGLTARVGHLALAVGRPGPSGPMASFGAISTVGGPWRTPSGATVEGYLRADVAMLPGFSGGPLVDGQGGVLGLNSSTLGRGGGLTLPNGAIDAVVTALQTHGKVRRGYLGIGTQGVRLPDALVQTHALPTAEALLVTTVEGDSPADRGGLLIGDIIVAVEGQPVSEVEQLQDHLSGDRVGKPIALKIVRGGAPLDLPVVVGER